MTHAIPRVIEEIKERVIKKMAYVYALITNVFLWQMTVIKDNINTGF